MPSTRLFPSGFPKYVFSNGLFRYLFSLCQSTVHQICTTYLLREMAYLGEYYKEQNWTECFTIFLMRISNSEQWSGYSKNKQIRRRQQSLLEEKLDSFFLLILKFLLTIMCLKGIFEALKLNLNTAGCFRTVTGAQIFSQLKTIRKNEGQAFEVLGFPANDLE